MRVAVGPRVNRRKKGAVSVVVDGGKGGFVPVAVDLEHSEPVPPRLLEERRKDVGGPGNTIRFAVGAGVVGDWRNFAHEQAKPVVAAPQAT